MTRSRDMADAGKIINYLDEVSSSVQTQIGDIDPPRYGANTQDENITLTANTHYLSGEIIINNGVTMILPVDSLIEIQNYAYGKAL